MHLSILSFSFSIVLLGPWLAAQTATTISPKSAAKQGNALTNIPFAWVPTRYQQIFDADSFTHGTSPFIIKGVRYRMSKGYANGRWGGKSVTLSMWLGSAAKGVSATRFSFTFDQNFDPTTKKAVIKKKKFVLPFLSNRNFDIKFPFDSPQIFVLVPSKKIPLVQEVMVWGNSNANSPFVYPIDFVRVPFTSPRKSSRLYAYKLNAGLGSYTTNGTYLGCSNLFTRLPTHFSDTTHLKVGDPGYFVYGTSRFPKALTFLVLGVKSLNIPIFGKGCILRNDLVFVFTGIAANTSIGFIRFPLPLPNNPSLAKAKFYSQMWFAQPNNGGLYFYATRGLVITIGDGKSKSPDLFKKATTIGTGDALITQFHN